MISLCTSVVKRTLFDKVSIPAIYNAEDTAMMPILVYKSSKVSYISQPLYHYLYRPGSLSTAKSDQIAKSFYQAFSFLANSIPNEYKDEICFRGIKMLLYGVFYHVIRLGGNPKKAEKMIAEFFKSYPKWRCNQYFHTLPFRKKFFVYMVDWHAYSILRLYCKVQEFLFNKKFNI